ncbi:MAG: SDR family oxidoreductase, partial [Acidimicrobiia bacterium]
MSHSGKVVAVTGAARGLGRAYCEALGAAGARVVAIDRDDPTETAAASGAGALALLADVVDVESLQAVAARVDDTCGRIDGLVNNAGMWAGIHGGRFDAIDPDEWDRCMEVNVKGVWNVTRVLAGLLRRIRVVDRERCVAGDVDRDHVEAEHLPADAAEAVAELLLRLVRAVVEDAELQRRQLIGAQDEVVLRDAQRPGEEDADPDEEGRVGR